MEMERVFRSNLHPKANGLKTREKKHRVYFHFMDLGKTYDRVNREVLRQVL